MSQGRWTEKQGQYLAFIYNYTLIHGEPPAGPDMRDFFGVSSPAVYQMINRLEERGLISRDPGRAFAIEVLVPPDELPRLKDRREATSPKDASEAPVYQIRVTLAGIEPPIWRRVHVPSDITLAELHDVLQAVMGWWDYHLHQFTVGAVTYGVPHPDDWMEVRDERRVRLNAIADEGSRLVYEYDFGDSWEHVLEVERVLEPVPGRRYPVCIEGERATPPEDVGGIWGYELYLEAMQDPDHPEHEEYLEWRGEFDPELFDLRAVNRALRELR
ncbi:MAG: LexA family transcriptional regulator [Anaerolineae bacterium]|jgi:hypothetical protein